METPSLLPDAIAVSLDIVSKESLAEKIISVDFIGVLLGVILGGLVTFGTQYFVDKRHAEEQKRLSPLLSLVKYMRYLALLKNANILKNFSANT